VAAGGIQVARGQLVIAEVVQQLPLLEPVPGLAEQPQGLGCIASRACRVPVKALCVRTSRQQPGGQVRLPEAAGQAKALFDERQSGAGLPFAQEDPGMLTQRVGGQVLIAKDLMEF